jgi:tetratricopeptide (TPR) repeat protein
MDSRRVIARFEAERQALAMMDHPNIARILDAGATDTGRPFFVMDLVSGVPIAEFCDANQLSIRHRLALVLDVCHAVQHAHQKGIIHRDIKPSNVLVAEYDGRPVPKVIDFGVAKATAPSLTQPSLFTEHGQLVGTFDYMSPEQASFHPLDVDTRSDIYSLGVLLYRLLAGETPFAGQFETAGIEETLRVIREGEPPKPSETVVSKPGFASLAASRRGEAERLSQEIRGELDWIVMKAMEKDRSRRYPTANDLALDIQRYLDDEPVEARPPTRTYRLGKFLRRNKTGMAASGLVAGALLAAVVLLLVSNARIRREAVAREEALKSKEAALATAQDAVDRMLTQVASERFRDMPLSHPLRISLLEDARAYYERLSAHTANDSALQSKVAEVLHLHAGLLREVGEFDRAAEALRQSRQIWQSLVDSDPNPPNVLTKLARVESDLAFTLHRGDERRLEIDRDAETQYGRALALSRELEQRWPGRCEPDLLGRRMLAKLASQRGDRAQALRLWREGLNLGENYVQRDPKRLDASIEVGWTCVHLHDALADGPSASVTDLEQTLTRGLKTVDRTLANTPESTRAVDVRASLQIRLAQLFCREGRTDEAIAQFDQAISSMKGLCEGSPWNGDYWNSLRWFHSEVATKMPSAGQGKYTSDTLQHFRAWLQHLSGQSTYVSQHPEQVQVSHEYVSDLLGNVTGNKTVAPVEQNESQPPKP